MGRFLAFILTCLVSLSLTAGTAARAAEPIRCVGSDAAAHLGYVDDVREQVTSEDDKAAAHHHGSCKGEQVGEPEKEGFATQANLRTAPPLLTNEKARVSSAPDPNHRPPKARSEDKTSEITTLMRKSNADFCLKYKRELRIRNP